MCKLQQILARLKKSVIWSSGTSRFSFWANNFSLTLSRWARDQSSSLPTKSLKEQTDLLNQNIILELLVPRASWNSSFFESCLVIEIR